MLTFDQQQHDELLLTTFERRVGRFVAQRALSPALQALAARSATVADLCREQRFRTARLTEHDAAVLLTYALACRADGVDPERGIERAQAQPQPTTAMKIFLSQRGHVRFTDFDLPLDDD